MGIFRKINVGRMAIMRSLASNIGGASTPIGTLDPASVKRVLISRPNGRLGNLLLITPLLQEVTATFPNARIDLFVKGGLAPILFSNYPAVDRIIQLPKKPFRQLAQYAAAWLRLRRYRYDMVINVVHYSSSGRLSTRLANASHRLFGDVDPTLMAQYADRNHIAKHVVYNFRNSLPKLNITPNGAKVAPLNMRLTPFELAEGRETLAGLADKNKKTICLFTYATGSKCYSAEWWQTYYGALRKEYPNHNIIEVLPVENVSQIGFSAPSFYSKDIRRIGALIANTDVFIGADSGIMHLATAVQTRTVGLFSVTDPETFGPYGENNVAINTNNVSFEEQVRILNTILTKAKPPKHDMWQSA